MLEKLEETHNSTTKSFTGGTSEIELIQAWLLLVQYELLRVNECQATITAGRAFRLIQVLRMFEVDRKDSKISPKDISKPVVPSSAVLDEGALFAEVEEKRRTFWLAYCFDRFLSWKNDLPLTLHEDMVRNSSSISLHKCYLKILSLRLDG